MSFPTHARYVLIGAGIHGLSAAWRLAERLQVRSNGRGSGADVMVLDKTAIAAGASGIACGCGAQQLFPARDARADGAQCPRLGVRS